MPKPVFKLDNWCIVNVCGSLRAAGRVYGNPKFHDGEEIITSEVLEIDEGCAELETKNSVYILGEAASPKGNEYVQ